MSQIVASNENIWLYTAKTTPTVSHSINFHQKILGHSLKCLKYTTP
jgi:hypothetical protein